MSNPAKDSGRILIGLGLGLIVITGLSMQFGLLPPTKCNNSTTEDCTENSDIGLIIPVLAFSSTAIGLALFAGINLPILSSFFPNQSENQLEKKLKMIENDLGRDKNTNLAWATLEEKVLSKKVGEEE